MYGPLIFDVTFLIIILLVIIIINEKLLFSFSYSGFFRNAGHFCVINGKMTAL